MEELIKRIRQFVKERDWEQFHSPKNLTMALSVEVAEVMEHFQWRTEQESRKLDIETHKSVKDEIGDIFIYFLRLCDELKINPIKAANNKIKKNTKKYPVEKSKGNARKYTKL